MTNFTKTEKRFIDYLESICDTQQEIDVLIDGKLTKKQTETIFKYQKELMELKREFFNWFKKLTNK